MALIQIAPDKEFVISEERLRFAVPADIPPAEVPFHLYLSGVLQQAIETYTKFRGWRMIDAVPQRKKFLRGQACCDQLKEGKNGDQITLRFLPSSFQGDTDDAHNFGELSNPDKRMYEDNLIDWVAVIHFWVPTIPINLDKEREISNSLSYANGFTPLSDMPAPLQDMLKRKSQ